MAAGFSDQEVLEATAARPLRTGARSWYAQVCTDTRELSPGCLFLALEGERFDAHQFLPQAASNGAIGAVINRGKSLPQTPRGFALFEVDDTLAALGALARFHRLRFRIPLAAVTGSNGKTTTKEMAHAILSTRGPALKSEGNFNNEVGLPLTLLRLEPAHVAAVVEMGMNRPGEIARLTAIARPDAGLVTVVQPAHLEGLGTLESIAAAKGELFHGLPPDGTAVVNLDDPHAIAQAEQSGARALTFGRAENAQVRIMRVTQLGREGLSVLLRYQGLEYPVRLAFVGEHNSQNAAGAFALACALGYAPKECVRGLESAKARAHRLAMVDAAGGIFILDDSYNANPSSMAAALRTLASLAKGGRAVAVLGDMLELGPDEARQHRALGELAAQNAQLLAFFGPRSAEAHRAAAALERVSSHFDQLEALLAWLRPKLRKGDVVLVKASRGMQLERVVEALGGSASAGAIHA